MAPNFANPKGYWEPADIVDLHDEMLAAAGSSWNDVAGFPLSWLDSPEGQIFPSPIARQLPEAFGDAPLALLKDPQDMPVRPAMDVLLESLEIEPLVVIPIRNPLEVAASLKARDERAAANVLGTYGGMPDAKALLLWLRCFLDAERHTRGFPRSFVSYERCCPIGAPSWPGWAGDLGITWPVHRTYRAGSEPIFWRRTCATISPPTRSLKSARISHPGSKRPSAGPERGDRTAGR